MMKAKKNVLGAVGLTIIYGIFSYFSLRFFWSKGWFISQQAVTPENIGLKLLDDCVIGLSFVVVILTYLLIKRRSLTAVGFTTKSGSLSILLFAVYLYMFISYGDFTLKGWYLAFFYLIVVAFSEEFIFRGFLFSIIDREYGFWTGVVISGLLFGAMHGLLPTIVANGSLSMLFSNICNELGGGIFGSLLFAWLYTKSGTLFVPILIHAILDYSAIVF